ncbi:MAG: hypothetical protein ACREGJ_04380 [Candidatus Saccharimonadales bacterium]
MTDKDPVLTIAGRVPCIGRTDVGHDYKLGKAAAKAGDFSRTRELAESLRRFSRQHVLYMLGGVATAVIHIANAKNGGPIDTAEAVYDGIYALAQASFVRSQATLSRKLYEKADAAEAYQLASETSSDIHTAEDSTLATRVATKQHTEQERPTPPMKDKLFTAATQGTFAITAIHAAMELASAASDQL